MTSIDMAKAKHRQAPGADYGSLQSLVSRLAPERRSNRDLTDEERTNLETYLKYKTIEPHERAQFHTPGFTLHRRGFVHLPAMTGSAGKEMDHSALLGRFDEIEDVIVKGDRLWSVFTLRAKHVGAFYRQSPSGKDLAITEMCCLRFEGGKLAEGWFLGDEVSICRQIGIAVNVPHVSSASPSAAVPAVAASASLNSDEIAARQKPGTDYGRLKSVVVKHAAERRSGRDLTDEEQANLECFLRYKTAKPSERKLYQTATYTGHRRGIIHLPELRGIPGQELDHGALEGRIDEIEDLIVKGDRLWCAFTLRARHVGSLYGMPPTGRTVEMLEYCALRFENSKIAEGWFFGDELGLARQIGIPIGF